VLGDSESRTADRAPASRDPHALVGTILAERYRIEELLGQGGMGTVYRAEHVHMKRTVALKVLHPEIAAVTEIAARFEREAIAVGRIEHPNVAKAMDFGRLPDGSFYLVVEYVKGTSLRELIQRGPLAPPRALDIARQIAGAIKAAHEAGVVHRDLKPDNVMLGERDGVSGHVKVLDFGVAKLASDEASAGSPITRYGAIVGTFEYMAPEQGGGGAVDHRADLYALGVILYELLSGRPPFSSDEPLVMLSKHFVEPPPPLPDSVSEKTSAIVFELLAKDPAARIQSAAELIARIDEAQAELGASAAESQPEPTTIDDGTGALEATERPRRSRFALALAGAAVMALMALAVVLAKRPKPAQAGSAAPTNETSGQPAIGSAAANQAGHDSKTSAAALNETEPTKASAAATETSKLSASETAPPEPATPPETGAAQTSAGPEAVAAPASTSAVRPATPQKASSARRPGRRVIVRRTIVRRTIITTTR